MAKWVETVDYARAKSEYGELTEDEHCTLWAIIQLYGIDMVLEGIMLAKDEQRDMAYVEKYCDMMCKENKIVEEMWNETILQE